MSASVLHLPESRDDGRLVARQLIQRYRHAEAEFGRLSSFLDTLEQSEQAGSKRSLELRTWIVVLDEAAEEFSHHAAYYEGHFEAEP